MGLVGESGCGKTTLGQLLVKLLEPSGGKIYFKDRDITGLNGKKVFDLRRRMQIVFQHPESAFNPRMRVYDSMAEPVRIHGLAENRQVEKDIIYHSLKEVGIEKELLGRYPRELSGGQIQRLALARVLILKPEFVVADEPTSMLDVSVQAQVLELMQKLKQDYGITMLFISHDLEVVRCISDRLAVMRGGQIVEVGKVEEVFEHPGHPYSKELFSTLRFL